ncbi:cache domain-containing sensor histidine kinase [Paenibacillus tyrfis]|uniref:cache domain-containing sensor histidine kinase n=1 Tax=Paenibacillus tyrfis TaxID=1501230 RepID=UPI00209D5EBA|nr:sensor histidine kinase [Paenibacillus tyrfis]MCP1308174.1 sensor histidine kinase [Paenibacillus tyrfis]
MRTWIQALSLRGKLMAGIVVCLLLPAVVSFFVSNWFTQDVMKEQVTRNSQESLKIVDQYVANQLDRMLYILNLLQFDPDLHLFVTELGRMDPVRQPYEIVQTKLKLNKRLDAILASFDPLYLTILLPNGDFWANYSSFDFDPKQLFDKPWYQETSELVHYQTRWVGGETNYVRNTDGVRSPYVLTLAKPIRSGDQLRAVAVVSLDAAALLKLFSSSKKEETLLITDREGRIVFDKEMERIGTLFPFRDQLPSEGQASLIEVDGEANLLIAEALNPHWQLVSMSPYKQASKPIQAIRRIDFLIQTLCLIVFAGVLLYLTGALTTPIRRLAQTVVRIESGHLGERSGIRGRDEVGRLGFVFDRMLDRIEMMVQSIIREQEHKRKAELAMLQAQINPHFLFNILNSIRMRILLRGDAENADLISSLSSLLRMTINRNNEFISLHEEIEMIGQYVRLINVRLGDRLHLKLSVASDAVLAEVPRFVLQPIIENAYLHGFARKGGTITIHAHLLADGRLNIVIADSGVGISKERLERLRADLQGEEEAKERTSTGLSGIGLRNVYERLRLIYKEHCSFVMDSEPGQGTTITLVIPQQREEE